MAKAKRVRLYPTGSHFIGGVAAVERIVPARVAAVLTAGTTPAFTRERPEGQDEPSENVREDVDDIMANMEEFRTVETPPEVEGAEPIHATMPGGMIEAADDGEEDSDNG